MIGNPPYDVLSELETGSDLSPLRAAIDDDPIYAPSVRGKNNLYKLFVCKSLDLLAEGGYLGFITPMAILGDDQAADLRRYMAVVGRFAAIEAFPQKDDPKNRVFPEAKLSTAVFLLVKDGSARGKKVPFRSHVHRGRVIDEKSPGLTLTMGAVPLYDPSNLTIVSCDQSDWNLATRIMEKERMGRLGDHATSFQGEVNETNDRKARRISYNPKDGPEVMRGAHLCLYAFRPASQGTPVYVCVDRFLDRRNKGEDDQKAFHHRHARIGFQRKSPQNNFRRLIAAFVPSETFLLESVSYVPAHHTKLPLELILGVLNSKLCDWYFRLGSTNAMVGEYQFNNLPCPVFSELADDKLSERAMRLLAAGKLDQIEKLLDPLTAVPPFGLVVRDVIVTAVERIASIEAQRGEIARADRSALDPTAQPFQDLIDRLFYRMAGLSDAEATQLELRLSKML